MKTLADLMRSKPIRANGHDNPWVLRSPLAEARDLFRMVNSGSCTAESTRELIAIPPKIEFVLRTYAEHFPQERENIYSVLRFRRRVAEEFDRLMRVGNLAA